MNSVLKAAFPITLSLVIGAAIIWVVLGVLSGILSAVRSRTFADRLFTGLALFFYSMPTFVLGLLLLLVFYYELTIHGIHAFPPTYIPFSQSPTGWFRSLILPWFTLALVSAATYTRLTRGSMLDVMNEDYIRTARAKGLSERRVIFRHSLRAALTPIVTQFGLDVGILLGGAVITEVVFSMPGLGYTAVAVHHPAGPAGDHRRGHRRLRRRGGGEHRRGRVLRRAGPPSPPALSFLAQTAYGRYGLCTRLRRGPSPHPPPAPAIRRGAGGGRTAGRGHIPPALAGLHPSGPQPSGPQPSRADCMGRNLAWASASSASGSESATMPPPANSRARVPSTSAQRSAMHHSPFPALSTQPTGPA